MPCSDQKLALEIAQMHRESRRRTLLQALPTAALVGAGALGGLAGLHFTHSEIIAPFWGITAAAVVAHLMRKYNW